MDFAEHGGGSAKAQATAPTDDAKNEDEIAEYLTGV
jgi:hypothetical protein